MNRPTRKTSILVCALLAVIATDKATAADLRYQGSGDYFDTVAVTGANGWLAGGGGAGGLPGTADTARCNWGNNTVTLAGVAPDIRRFQLGVDESGHLVVESGGKLTCIGGSSRVGNNNVCTGRLTVNAGGEVNCIGVLEVAGGASTGIATINGGRVNLTTHLWVGVGTGVGTIYITNGGVINVGGNIGLGTINANTPSGGQGLIFVGDGGALNLTTISPVTSIQPGSRLDLSGSGVVTKTGDFTAVMSAYTNAGRITAYGGTGAVGIDYGTLNAGKTTLFAIEPQAPPPTNVVWNPAGNPAGTGKWSEDANWDRGVAPFSVTKVNFNVAGAIPCRVDKLAVADHVVMGENGPGGGLTVASGGSLAVSSTDNASVIGYNNSALLVVEDGGAVGFAHQLWIGLDPGSDGTLTVNGGTVSVANMFGLGWNGGKGTAQINGGTLSLAQWDDTLSIQGASVLSVAGTGTVVISGDHVISVSDFINTGQITNSAGPGTVLVDYGNIHLGKTTIYPAGLYVAPERSTWDPAANPATTGLWSESANWTGGILPGSATLVRFNVPDAIPCTVASAAAVRVVRMGIDGGPGGTLIVTNGGSLVCASGDDNWCALGYNQTALMTVEDGGSASFGNHLWVGFSPGGDGTLVMNGGTVSVGQMFGLGWNGGKGTAQINGGTLNLSQLHPTDSIKGESLLNITGTGRVVITGDHVTPIGTYAAAGRITANGGPNVFFFYDVAANRTFVSAALLPAPPQAITSVSVAGGDVTITYQTTRQHTYHIEGSPGLSPASWTTVPGSTIEATGAPVTFTFPASGGRMFYRTVSP